MLEINPDTSIGIEEVRQIQHFLSRKPIQSESNTVIVHQAHLLTVPAQNALLKTLEEPPGNSLIYLVTDFPDQLLPTVLSRVQLENSEKRLEISKRDLEKIRKLLDELLAAGVGERLKLMEAQAFTRETALEFLDQLENIIHSDLSTPSRPSPPNLGGDHRGSIYKTLVDTRRYLKANCNVKLTMDNFGLNLSNTTPSVPSYAGGETYAGK